MSMCSAGWLGKGSRVAWSWDVQTEMNIVTNEEAQAKSRRIEQENELLLQQLQQVQEELKRQFQLSQENKRLAAPIPASQETTKANWGIPLYKLTGLFGLAKWGQIHLIRSSDLFDGAWYLKRYPDVAEQGIDPATHYFRCGAKESRNPGPGFSTSWYLKTYRDVAEQGVNPLLHYVLHGQKEQRKVRKPDDAFAKERKSLTQARDKQARLAEERLKWIWQLKKACDEQSRIAAERQQQIEQITLERDDQARLAGEYQQQFEQISHSHDQQLQLSAEHLAQIEQFSHKHDELTQLVAELQQQLEQLGLECDEKAWLAVEHEQQIEQLSHVKGEQARKAESMENEMKNLRDELREAKETAAMSVKLQTLREMDLKELQDRFQDSKAKQEEQYQLLTQLSEKLRAVSAYFHQVTDGDETNLVSRDNVLSEK
jgi:hypothetical protein